MTGPRWWFFGTHPKTGAVTMLAEATPKLGESHARVLAHLLADDTRLRVTTYAPKGKGPLSNPALRLPAGGEVKHPRWVIYDQEDGTPWAIVTAWINQRGIKNIARNVATSLARPVALVEERRGGKSNPSTDDPIYDGQIWRNFQTGARVKVINSDRSIVVFKDLSTGDRGREQPMEFKATHTLLSGRRANPKRHKGGPMTLAQVARELTAHHLRTAAGFYGMGGRWFGARVRAGRLQVWDFDTWRDVPAGTPFHDHNGQPILTVPGESNPKRPNPAPDESDWGICSFCGERRPLAPGTQHCTWCEEDLSRKTNPKRRITAESWRNLSDYEVDQVAHNGNLKATRTAAKRELARRGVKWTGEGVADRIMGRTNARRRNPGFPEAPRMSLSELVELRAGQAYKLSLSKKSKEKKLGYLLTGAVQVAGEIMGEHVPELEKEHRIKRLFMDVLTGVITNPGGPRIVYNRLLGGWYVVTGPHQTPLNGRFNSKAEAQAWLGRKNPRKTRRTWLDQWAEWELRGSGGREAAHSRFMAKVADFPVVGSLRAELDAEAPKAWARAAGKAEFGAACEGRVANPKGPIPCDQRRHNPGCPCDPRCCAARGNICECHCGGAYHKSGSWARNPRGGYYIAWLNGSSVAVGKTQNEVQRKAVEIFNTPLWQQTVTAMGKPTNLRITSGHRQLFVKSIMLGDVRQALPNPSWRLSGTLEEVPDAPPVRRRGPGRPRKLALAPVELAPAAPQAGEVPFEVPGEAEGRDLQPGDRVTVPYSGKASYFGRAVKHTRESGIFEGYTYENDQRLAFVRVNRGGSVETHAFPVNQVRLHGKSFAEQAAAHRAGRPAKLARLTWKAKGNLAKAEAMLAKAIAEHADTEAVAMELYPQHEATPGRPRGRTAPASREYLNARAKLRRLTERVELLDEIVRSLSGVGQATGTDPWATNRRWRTPNPIRHKYGASGTPRTVRGAKRKRNPRGSEYARAVKTFQMWHEFDPHRVTRIKGPDRMIPRTLVKLGDIRSIDYISDKYEGRPVTYTHKTDRPRPVLATDPDGRNLHIVGGKVKITADGLIH